MPERTQRYSEAERAEQAATRRDRAGRASYGGTYAQQGVRPVKEQGMAFLKRQELKAKYGAFANPTWDYEDRGGQLYRKPKAGQSGRIAEQGGSAQWEPVPDYVQRSYSNPQRRAFFEQNPQFANQPGGGQDYWLYAKRMANMKTDPATGMKVNRFGELYDPNAMGQQGYTGGSIGQQGMGIDPSYRGGMQPGGMQQPPFMGGPQGPMTGGGFMGGPQGFAPGGNFPGQPNYAPNSPWLRSPGFQAPGYIPGYALPGPGSPRQPPMAPPGSHQPRYNTLQPQGQAPMNPFQNYQPRYNLPRF